MISPSALASILTIGTLLVIGGLVAYRLLWAASGFAGYFAGARMLPKRFERWQRWVQGETTATRRPTT